MQIDFLLLRVLHLLARVNYLYTVYRVRSSLGLKKKKALQVPRTTGFHQLFFLNEHWVFLSWRNVFPRQQGLGQKEFLIHF